MQQAAGGGPSFSCSQCGGRGRFRTLASLRTHLDHLHPRPPCPARPLTPQEPGGRSLPAPRGQRLSGGGVRCVRTRRTQSVGGGVPDGGEEEGEGEEGEDAGNMEDGGPGQMFFLNRLPSPSPKRPPPDQGPDPRPPSYQGPDPRPPSYQGPDPRPPSYQGPDPRPPSYQGPHQDPRPPPGSGSDPGGPRSSGDPGGRDGRAGRTDRWRLAGVEAAVRGRLAVLLRAADSSMQRRLARVSWELARTDTELLCARAHRQHLADGRQEAAERQRSLSRQVDVAVMVIAALREQLSASENQLEQREREALSIQSVLAAAAHQEACGRVRVQSFIETLLERIALAERLVHFYQEEYYHRASPPTHTQPTERAPQTRSKSRPSLDQDQDQGQDWVWDSRQRCRSLGYEV